MFENDQEMEKAVKEMKKAFIYLLIIGIIFVVGIIVFAFFFPEKAIAAGIFALLMAIAMSMFFVFVAIIEVISGIIFMVGFMIYEIIKKYWKDKADKNNP